MLPARPSEESPVAINIEPDGPAPDALPDRIATTPLLPEPGDEPSSTEPLAPDALAPDDTITWPPRFDDSEAPPVRRKEAPSQAPDEPAVTVTPPAETEPAPVDNDT